MTKVTIYNPALQMGGSDILLANLAILLSNDSNFTVDYVEYKNGATLDYLKKNNANCNIISIDKNEKINVDNGVIIMILLHAKFIDKKIFLSDNVKMVFWSTHPEDGQKILPLFNTFFRRKEPLRKLLSNLITPIQKKRIKKFLEIGIRKKGIVWMDKSNFDYNEYFYNLKNVQPTFWPLITSNPTESKRTNYALANNKTITICILGRVIDFKVIPILQLLPLLIDYRSKINFQIIGTGQYEDILKTKLDKLGFNYKFVGHVQKQNLDLELLKSDIVFGIGTSPLEGAKLGIPTIVMNGSLFNLKLDELKYEWLYNCPVSFVGDIKMFEGQDTVLSQDFISLLNEFYENREGIGNKCYDHWKANFSSKSFHKKVVSDIANNEFLYRDAKKSLKLTFLNKSVNSIKQFLLSRK